MTSRDESQEKIVQDALALYKRNELGAIIIAVTGYGKTRCAFMLIKHFNKDKTIHVVVPKIPLKAQWEEEIAAKKLPHNIKVWVINSYLMLDDEERICDLLITDEIHRISNDDAILFNTVIDKTSFTQLLGMSATLTIDQLRFLNDRGIKVVANISIEEAVAKGWVSKYVQYNLAVQFTPEEREKYTKADNVMKAHSPYFEGIDPFKANKDKLALARYCQEQGLDYRDVQMRIARYNVMSAVRKACVYGSYNKMSIIPSIVNHIGKKTIIFSETQKFAEAVHKTMPTTSVYYHSNMKPAQKLKALTSIKDDTVKVISTAKALDEGIDMPSLKCGIIASGTSVERQQIQRCGRIIRYVKADDIAIVVNLYVQDTMEINWLKKRQKNMSNIRWIISVEQIEQI